MTTLSPDALAQVLANVVIGLIAVVGAIWGARVGAAATRDATTTAIAAQQAETRAQRIHEEQVKIRALVTECRLNAATLRKEREYMPDPRFLAPLRQSAFDAATSALADLPEAGRTEAQDVLQDVLWFNQLIATRLEGRDERGDTVARALVLELRNVGVGLPDRLDALANRLEGASTTT